ncbi:MAG: GAF domain protein [Candidatus Aerophobetes bacterium ADurb.Bin490]|nr:MAG: GAF domain protein [Candidatus Aerophobetes bacterium ADurb.Bin490]HPI04271.1 GAF domain-containing protein [Candidatus Goldiibacteriota bacterium]HPN64096.1 GAF domain-containing protein [Candidatus Goldiibacteriota bacterium]HRQ43278.1 GAF domain-containing protein [Candidatus Goldiibacteriota bacterium]
MKNVLISLVKLSAFVLAVAAIPAVMKLDQKWILPALFTLNFSIAASYVLSGFTAGMAVLVISFVAYIFAFLRFTSLKADLWTLIVDAVIAVVVFIIVKKYDEASAYHKSSMNDELKKLEGGHDALIKQKISLEAGLVSNREKAEKYRKLDEIRAGIGRFEMFSEKMRYLLKSVISVFHCDKKITLFLIRENKSIKISADKENDVMIAERDAESLYLKNFDEWVISSRKSIIISDMHKEIRFKDDKSTEIRSLISVPVFAGSELVGLLKITSDSPAVFSQEDLRFLDMVGAVAGKVLEVEEYAK